MKRRLRSVRATRVGCRLSSVSFTADGRPMRVHLNADGRALVTCGAEAHVVLPNAPPHGGGGGGGAYEYAVSARRRAYVLTEIRISRGGRETSLSLDPDGGAVLACGRDVVVIRVPASPKLAVLQAGDDRYAAVVLRAGLPDVPRGDLDGSVLILDGEGEFRVHGERLAVVGERIRVGGRNETVGVGEEIFIGGRRAVVHTDGGR